MSEMKTIKFTAWCLSGAWCMHNLPPSIIIHQPHLVCVKTHSITCYVIKLVTILCLSLRLSCLTVRSVCLSIWRWDKIYGEHLACIPTPPQLYAHKHFLAVEIMLFWIIPCCTGNRPMKCVSNVQIIIFSLAYMGFWTGNLSTCKAPSPAPHCLYS